MASKNHILKEYCYVFLPNSLVFYFILLFPQHTNEYLSICLSVFFFVCLLLFVCSASQLFFQSVQCADGDGTLYFRQALDYCVTSQCEAMVKKKKNTDSQILQTKTHSHFAYLTLHGASDALPSFSHLSPSPVLPQSVLKLCDKYPDRKATV